MSLAKLTGRRKPKGFTLIELLVVVLILAILMAIALPLYLNAIADSEKKTCRSNMQTIANAVQAARVETRAGNYAFATGPVSVAIEPDLGTVPVCPSGGTYTIENGTGGTTATYRVKCSLAAHGTFEPGVDNT